MAWREWVDEIDGDEPGSLLHVLSCGHRVRILCTKAGDPIRRRYCTTCTPPKPAPERVWVVRGHVEYAAAVLRGLLAQCGLDQPDRASAALLAFETALRRVPVKDAEEATS